MTKLLTRKEVAEALQVSEDTLFRGDVSRQLRSIKVGRHVRYRPEWVEEYLRKRTVEAAVR